MSRVFLSYRRGDTGAEAGRLADALRQQLGTEVVFRDVQSIPPGTKFDERLSRELDSADVVLVLIGPGWLDELKRRLESNDTDFVLLEISTALKAGKRLIPILLGGASLPATRELPEAVQGLTRRQVMSFRDESWDSDVARLVAWIGRPYRWRTMLVRAVVAVPVIVLVARFLTVELVGGDGEQQLQFAWSVIVALGGLYAAGEVVYAWRLARKRRGV